MPSEPHNYLFDPITNEISLAVIAPSEWVIDDLELTQAVAAWSKQYPENP